MHNTRALIQKKVKLTLASEYKVRNVSVQVSTPMPDLETFSLRVDSQSDIFNLLFPEIFT